MRPVSLFDNGADKNAMDKTPLAPYHFVRCFQRTKLWSICGLHSKSE